MMDAGECHPARDGAAVPAGDDWNYIASALCRVERETAQRFSEQQPWYIAPFIYAY